MTLDTITKRTIPLTLKTERNNLRGSLRNMKYLRNVLIAVGIAFCAELSAMEQDNRIGSVESVRKAVEDMIATYGDQYPKGESYLKRLGEVGEISDTAKASEELNVLQKQALLDNPLIRESKILCVRREYVKGARNSRDANMTTVPNFTAYAINNVRAGAHPSELIVIDSSSAEKESKSLFKMPYKTAIAEIDLNFDADRILFSAGTEKEDNYRWQLWEIHSDGTNLKRLTPENDYGSFDGMYLPDGNIIFNSTAAQQGLPCEAGRILNSNMYKLDRTSSDIERLTFDQDSNWCPTMMENGRVMYLRWEYSDLAHIFSRILMTMNPDGTTQVAHYGSNSYWPNGCFDAKPIPGAPSRFIAVITGHHVPRTGTLCLFDVSRGRTSNRGVITEIPDEGVKPTETIADRLYQGRWPKCLNPYPLGTSEDNGAGRYFLVSAKLTNNSLWGIYLVDIFGNFTLIKEEEGFALNEPIPFAKTKRPPVVPSRIDRNSKEGTVYIQDIYAGPGLKNVPRGKVKNLRLFTYHYAYGKVGSHDAIGVESSWDVKRVLGTVPVEEDGSALFNVPVNMPISIQPIDENGASLQLMRSWFVARPGENVSCIGCHEDQNMAPLIRPGTAARKAPVAIEPWNGPVRGFAFLREIQPILDARCIACHDGKERPGGDIPNFDDITEVPVFYSKGIDRKTKKEKISEGGPFPKSYVALNPYVRRPGPESDINLFNPMEYHSSTSILTQLLKKGHHNVKLTDSEWDRINTWIDLNAPCFGTYTEAQRNWMNGVYKWAGSKTHEEMMERLEAGRKLRAKYMDMYSTYDEDPESEALTLEQTAAARADRKPIRPEPLERFANVEAPANWPFIGQEAQIRTVKIGTEEVAFSRIPQGSFVMGDSDGYRDEMPHVATIEKPFWMARRELAKKLYIQFKKDHKNGRIDIHGKDHRYGRILVENEEFPVIRVSWQEAQTFCEWASEKTGKKFRLPTESEWEWAARAGTDTPHYFGVEAFGQYANLADKSIEKFNRGGSHNYILRVDEVDDKNQAMANYDVDYNPNAFGLYNMIGNVAEWTASDYKPYPFEHTQSQDGEKVARGGSWRDLPRWATASYRAPYQPYQRVYNVGIRLVMDE